MTEDIKRGGRAPVRFVYPQADVEAGCARLSQELSRPEMTSVRAVRDLTHGLVSLKGRARARERVRSALSQTEVIGYRLVGAVGPESGRRQEIDFSSVCAFELEDAEGGRALVEGGAEIVCVPHHREVSAFFLLDQATRKIIRTMQRELDLRKTKPRVFLWSESRVCPEDEVRVIGVAREAISSDGTAGGYREAPRMWTFGPAPGVPLMVVIGEPEDIVFELSQSPWELPDRFRPRPQPVTAEDEDEDGGEFFD